MLHKDNQCYVSLYFLLLCIAEYAYRNEKYKHVKQIGLIVSIIFTLLLKIVCYKLCC